MSCDPQFWHGQRTVLACLATALACACAQAAQPDPAQQFRQSVQPILTEYCYDCHGDGAKKGGVAFDELTSNDALLNHDLWFKVLKNLRAGIMPPQKKPRPPAADLHKIEAWVKYTAFGLDPANPDPGRVTIRRLNRSEYRNTIRDLMGFDFKADDEFPPDDTGYGFDNIGDVLSVSPLLLEKYMQAAETIVAGAVPTVAKVAPEQVIAGSEFRTETNGAVERLSYYAPATVSHNVRIAQAGDYRIVLDLDIAGQFDFDPGRCTLALRVDGHELWKNEFGWHNHKQFSFEIDPKWKPGEHALSLALQPLTDPAKKVNSLDVRIVNVRVRGPLDRQHWARTKAYDRFFPADEPPASKAARRDYAREVMRRFATKAFRRPVDDRTVDRLADIAEASYTLPGKSFEEGITRAMVAVLSSPRFLFRIEAAQEDGVKAARNEPRRVANKPATGTASLLDEYSLASRLSYFLWSTMPDDELVDLARRGELRSHLDAQVKRMVSDKRSQALIENFTGQWLQARDVDGIDINARAVLSRDRGNEREIQAARKRSQELRAKPTLTPEEQKEREQLIAQFRRNRSTIELDSSLRRAMRQETELCFGYVAHEDRSVLELLGSDYTFLNERLAKHYGLTNMDVTGPEMRRVTLPPGSPRGGVLTEGTMLVVTSNPTRTSPVKRGLFVLDNILGVPPPPPPPNLPPLEEAEKDFKDHEPTLREILAAHRAQPLCSSCHNRMDPLGLAMENFNALGMWREKERGQPIEAAGQLITGETFKDVRELKEILKTRRHGDFYRCLTEKLLTYALGRGLEYYDVETVDQIVARLEREQGRFSALLNGVIESAPFQKRRNISLTTATSQTSEEKGQDRPRS